MGHLILHVHTGQIYVLYRTRVSVFLSDIQQLSQLFHTDLTTTFQAENDAVTV